MDSRRIVSRKADADKDWSKPWGSLKLQHRLILVAKFMHLHLDNIRAAVHIFEASSRPLGTVVDTEREAIAFSFNYNRNNEGNPAKMFTFTDAKIVPAANGADERLSEEGLAELEESRQRALERGRPPPVRLYLNVEGVQHVHILENRVDLTSRPPTLEIAFAETLGSAWIEVIGSRLRNGEVLVHQHGSGTLVRKGRAWTWLKIEE